MPASLTRCLIARPWRVIVGALLLLAVGVGVGLPVVDQLNHDVDSFADPGSSSARAVDRIEQVLGESAVPDLLILSESGDRAAEAVISEIGDRQGIARVEGGPGAGPEFVSRDGQHLLWTVGFQADADADALTRELRAELDAVPGIDVGGFRPAFQEVNERIDRDLLRAELMALPVLFAIALWVFRSVVAALLPLVVGIVTIVFTLLTFRPIVEFMEISGFALSLITCLGLGLAIDYSLFMVSRYREELIRRGEGHAAVQATVATAGRTVLFSALTVAGAGAALLVFPLRFLYSMGIAVVAVALVAAATALLVLPAVFALLGTRVNALAPRRWVRAAEREARAERSGGWYRLSSLVMRHPALFAVATAATLLVLAAPAAQLKLTGAGVAMLPTDSHARILDDTLREDFGTEMLSPMIVAVEAPSARWTEVQQYASAVRELPGVDHVTAPTYLGDRLWQFEATSAGDPLAQSSLDLVGEIRGLPTALIVDIGGESAEQVDQVAALTDRLPWALLILGLLTFVMLFLLTGSVILPLKAIVMNLLTIATTFGILVWVFQWGHGEGVLGFTSQGALESSQPVLLFAVVFGLSTDYAVFLLTRIKEARDSGIGDREAVAIGLQRTGRIVTAAALLLAIATGALALSSIGTIKELGIGIAVAVLIDATIVRALLVPALMALLGRANWWAPPALRRWHDRFGLRETDASTPAVQPGQGVGVASSASSPGRGESSSSV
ncbi:MMPL family transporter [Aeromicrobium sp. YIM 150415]|uniref:MMPL family transporter n=1 Tax=Aeromicrobium sp. YIM 150415 TaxID=2803912 RepID=UPI0019669403|nr:MMPL family transporter [Aeromicrobium sp. YIM 150415]MBM9463551.1 MMPL family transporter [Aeromicrobium sp. YIM 150415]